MVVRLTFARVLRAVRNLGNQPDGDILGSELMPLRSLLLSQCFAEDKTKTDKFLVATTVRMRVPWPLPVS